MERLDEIKGKLTGVEIDAWATVCIILRRDGEEIETLVVKRAVAEGDPWSGDMAFPGGKRAQCDADLRETVKREVMEETSMDLDCAEFLGFYPSILTSIRPGSTVLPQVYLYDGKPDIHLNEELSRYYWVHLSELAAHRCKALVKGRESSVFDLGTDKVWGLTYKMLDILLKMAGY